MSLQPISLVSEIEQFINLGKDTNVALETTFTINAAATSIKRKAPDAALALPTSTQWAEDTPTGFVSENTGIILGPANNTQYARTFAWRNLRRFLLDKMTFNLCFAMNASVNAGNDVNFDTVDVKFYHVIGGQITRIIDDKTKVSTGHTTLTGAGTQVYIYEESINPNKVIPENCIVIVDLTMNSTGGTATRQEGLMPGFPLSKSNATKQFSMSGVYMLGRSVQ